MKKILATVLALVTLAAFTSCGGEKKSSSELILNNGSEPQSLDPSKIQGVPEHRIYMALFEGLFNACFGLRKFPYRVKLRTKINHFKLLSQGVFTPTII